MKKREAGERARQWIERYGKECPDLLGAYFSGSYIGAPEDTEWPETSDIDLVLVFSQGKCPPKLGKFQENGVLLEATCLEEKAFSSLDHILSTHYLAFALNAGEILYDPAGKLSFLHRETAAHYGEERWVRARCLSFFERIRENIRNFDPEAPLPQRVNGWAFSVGLSCFPILAAALENCTVRKRFTAARKVLTRFGMAEFYPRLLRQLVPDPLGREQLSFHLEELEKTFSLACGTSGPSSDYPFRSDISPDGMATAIGGSRELIASDWPEEAVFWMLVTFARCHIILGMDAPELDRRRLPAFQEFLSCLGLKRKGDFPVRMESLKEFLPELQAVAERIHFFFR